MNQELAKNYFLAGLSQLEAESYEAAEASFRRSLEIVPDRESTLTNLSATLLKLKKYEEAAQIALKLIGKNDLNYQAWLNLGVYHYHLKHYQAAFDAYKKAADLNPGYVEAWVSCGSAAAKLGQYGEALVYYDKAISLKPAYAEAWFNRGTALLDLRQYDQALADYDKAIVFNPDYAEAWSNRAMVLLELRQYERALAACDQAISIKPDDAETWSNRGNILCSICRFEQAEASYREAIRIEPDNLDVRSSWLFSLNYLPSFNPTDALAEATEYGLKASERAAWKFSKWEVSPDPGRLKIGFVSGDLIGHPVGFFVEGLIEHLDPAKFELYAFATSASADDLTARIKPFFKQWTSIDGLSDEAAAELIHHKGIHVLIDLSGHTAHNRLPVFSYKPAPVQASWLGYFSTTGLPEMDYFIGDPQMSPASEARHFTEAVWRLPETWFCLKPPDFELTVSELPALGDRRLTFGSFGNLAKINDRVIGVWASVLNRVPGSRLLLKAKQFRDQAQANQVLARFESCHVSADRLIVESPESREAYFRAYNRVDFVLDTFPYPGGTTSVDALWMGVPVLTLKGDRFLSHLGESIAINAGLSDWIAEDIDDYVEKAVGFAADIERLAELRKALRGRVLRSPLFDTPRFAENFGAALWEMWHTVKLDRESPDLLREIRGII